MTGMPAVRMFEKKTMNSDDMEKVIDVASRFDKYILKVNDGMSDGKIAREERFRSIRPAPYSIRIQIQCHFEEAMHLARP